MGAVVAVLMTLVSFEGVMLSAGRYGRQRWRCDLELARINRETVRAKRAMQRWRPRRERKRAARAARLRQYVRAHLAPKLRERRPD